jgi:maltose/moltooligosaccharide transporter
VNWGGVCFAVYSAVCFAFSFALPWMARKLGRKYTHTLCLLCGALGLMSVVVIHNKYMLVFTMLGVGIAWASTLSMPYAVLAASLPPDRTGVYMGIFNFFIVTPEICASLFFGWIMIHLLNNNRIYAIIAGGIFMLIAAALMQRVKDPRTLSVQDV